MIFTLNYCNCLPFALNFRTFLVDLQTHVPLQQQQLLFNGKEMRNSEKLSALGVKDEDLVMMVTGAASR